MTLVQLANFVRIAELRSLSKAAAVIRIAQPALSRQVRLLEAELGAPLLVRHPWGVETTEAGEAFAAHAREVLRGVERARDAVEALAVEPSGRVAIGVPATMAACLLPQLAARLRERYPRMRAHFTDDFSTGLHSRMHAGELDLALLYADRAMGPVEAHPLLSEELRLVSGGDEPDGTPSEIVRRQPVILSARPSRLREIVDELLALHDVDPGAVIEVDSLPAILGMVQRGLGCTFFPYSTVHDEVARGLLRATSLGRAARARTLVLARPLERPSSAALRAAAREIEALVVELASALRWTPLVEAEPAPLRSRAK